MPWNNTSYVVIRLHGNTVLPEIFTVIVLSNAYYEIYLNGKEYARGYRGDWSSDVTLTVYSPIAIKISFPIYNISKVIEVSHESSATSVNLHYLRVRVHINIGDFSTMMVVWRDIKKRN